MVHSVNHGTGIMESEVMRSQSWHCMVSCSIASSWERRAGVEPYSRASFDRRGGYGRVLSRDLRGEKEKNR